MWKDNKKGREKVEKRVKGREEYKKDKRKKGEGGTRMARGRAE